ncbi:integral membrane single C2 domain isoform A [Chlorella sorokiniana]|uniref:Integral membrane single C2 domain isoform A n=1 Tax=Chlorella sorokiniana TaxID=3076 RepID=A0A2P6U4L7_CHLSO|nr:integral membrane single C2 domain isoform A [Chlorella sorokiniana]|eukprot:PRW61258.1 integral membrane single C2 domain isoform A [Chlorella sorokiniana]
MDCAVQGLAAQAAAVPQPLRWLLLGGLLATIIWTAAVLSLRWSERRWQRLQAATEVEWDEAALRRLFRESLPAWLSDPHATRQPDWLNAATRMLWPHIVAAAEQPAAAGQLQALLNGSHFWRPRWLRHSRVEVQAIYVGPSAPRVTAIKAVGPTAGAEGTAAAAASGGCWGAVHSEMAMDFCFTWNSQMEVKLLFYLFPGDDDGGGSRGGNDRKWREALRSLWRLIPRAMLVKIGVRQVVMRGTGRITLSPLLDRLPVVGGARVSLMGPPDFSYRCHVFGGNPFLLPGLEAWLNSFISTTALEPFLFPDGLDVPLFGAAGQLARQEPEGLLEVHVVEAANLPRMDTWIGKADPYCRLWLRDGAKVSTSVRGRTVNPRWDEHFTLIVHSAAHQVLNLVLYDSDVLMPDEEIGRAVVHLRDLDHSPDAPPADLWLPLQQPVTERRRRREAKQRAKERREGSRRRGTSDGGDSSRGGKLGHARRVRGEEGGAAAAAAKDGPSSSDSEGSEDDPRDDVCVLSRQHTGISSAAEAHAAAAAGGPGAAEQLRQLGLTDSAVPALLRSGVLTVYIEKAEGLSSRMHDAGFTRNIKVKVSVGDVSKVTERSKVALLHRRDPVFNEGMELLVDAETATCQDEQVEVEVFIAHNWRRDSFKGRVLIPLQEIVRKRRMRGSWPLQDAEGGHLTMELGWQAAAASAYGSGHSPQAPLRARGRSAAERRMAAQGNRKPLYVDQHASASVLVAEFRNAAALLALPESQQFQFLHHSVYILLDELVGRHKVYKLFGSSSGFMLATNVAEPDPRHATTLLSCARDLLEQLEQVRLPCGTPLRPVMALSTGPITSGLLGTVSLTYQLVGRAVSVARELSKMQDDLPFVATRSFRDALAPEAATQLVSLGQTRTALCLLLALAAAGTARACSHVFFAQEEHLQAHHRSLLAAAGNWDYAENGADWTGDCTGKAQSPIGITTSKLNKDMPSAGRAKLKFGKASGLKVINTGTAIQVEWDKLEGNEATVPVAADAWGAIFEEGGVKTGEIKQVPVKPLQMHWHSTCEHVVDGNVCALELHIVTAVDNTTSVKVPEVCNEKLCLAVFGIKQELKKDAYEAGDKFVQTVIDNLPKAVGKDAATALKDSSLDLDSLLPSDKDYATYAGSLTAPPCSEGVQWHVFLESNEILSAAQLDAFQAAFAASTGGRTTNRQIMPVNGRTILLSEQ